MADIEDNVVKTEGYKYDPNTPPSPEQILSILDSIKGLTDEDREQLRSEMLQRQAGKDFMHVAPQTVFNSQMLMLIMMLLIVTLIFEDSDIQDLTKLKLDVSAIKKAVSDHLDLNTMKEMIDKFKSMGDEFKTLSDEEKVDIQAKMRLKLVEAVKGAILKQSDILAPSTRNILVFIVAVLATLLLFVFFGYKLYKSLTEKERKRDEKKKMKQQKKRK